jgi:hypothetical protein
MSGAGAGEATEIGITMASTQPPQGEVAVEGRHRQPFVGWLQLLRILVEAVARPAAADCPPPPHAPSPQGATS